MASSLKDERHQRSSNCGICLERYRDPRRLRCQHYFCKECLENWVEHNTGKKEEIVCPHCKTELQIPAEGVQGFPAVNVAMAQATEDYSNKLCSKCKKPDLKAVVYCQDCEHYLCQSCLDVHNTWWEGHHSVASIEDMVSGKVSVADTKHKYCMEHEEEQNKFYCKTCKKLVCRDCILMVQHCRDHEYVTLKDAAKEKLSVIEEKMTKCDGMKKECEDTLEKLKIVMTGLEKAADDARALYTKMKSDYLHQVEEFFTEKERDVISLQEKRKAEIDSGINDIESQLKQLQSVNEQGKVLTDSASHYDIVAKYDSIVDVLEKISTIKLTEVDDRLADIPVMSIPPVIEFSESWKLVGQFNVPCEQSNDGPTGIDVKSDGNIAVCDYHRRVLVMSRSGDLIHIIDNKSLCGDGDVSITSSNGYAIALHATKLCKLYDSNYKLLSKFKTFNAKEESCDAWSITVDKTGCIILGMNDTAISIHYADGSLKSSFTISTMPGSVAVTSREEIAVAGVDETLRLYNYSGKCLQTLNPPPEVKTWVPWYVCCSTKDELFVVNRGDPKAIYKYAAGMVYMGCVTTVVNDPWGIALSHDDQELYVTEASDRLVKIFRKP